jgi:hypothetical protein
MITLLSQDPIGGLELQKRDGEWIGAPFIPGTLVINIGDLFQRWTNDTYRSNLHRVVNRTGKERYRSRPSSISTIIRRCRPPTCQSAGDPAKYRRSRPAIIWLSRFRDVQKHRGAASVDAVSTKVKRLQREPRHSAARQGDGEGRRARAGVSITTVSRVLNNPGLVASDKQDAVRRAAEPRLHSHQLARSLISRRSKADRPGRADDLQPGVRTDDRAIERRLDTAGYAS